jgi:hypothetical protein
MGDSLNNFAGGYARGQAQYAANEKARQDAAAAGAKAAQDAAEFRLKLATHSQALTNSAEDEWSAIMKDITSENWDPAMLPAMLPRVANFDKTYFATGTWKGGSAAEMLQKALHMNPTTAEGSTAQSTTPQPMGTAQSTAPQAIGTAQSATPQPMGTASSTTPQMPDELFGFVSQGQKDAADEKARKSRSADAARSFVVQAAEYARSPSGGLPDEATYYRKLYEFQDNAQSQVDANGMPVYDPATLDDAIDILRENAAPYFQGLANQLDLMNKNTDLSDKIRERSDKIIRNISQWVNQVLLFDASGNALTGDLFEERTPLRMQMESEATSLAMQGMSEGQIRANLIFKHRDEMGGLELDISKTPYAGTLTLINADPGFRGAVNRFYDLNEDPNEDQMAPMWRDSDGTGWIVNLVTGEGKQIYQPPSNVPTVTRDQGTPFPKGTTNSAAVVSTAKGQQPKQQAPAREVTIQLRNGSEERAARSADSAAVQSARDRENAARKSERMKVQSEKQAVVQKQQATADRNNIAFRLYRNGEITEEQFKEELRRSKAGEPSLLEVSR